MTRLIVISILLIGFTSCKKEYDGWECIYYQTNARDLGPLGQVDRFKGHTDKSEEGMEAHALDVGNLRRVSTDSAHCVPYRGYKDNFNFF